MNIIFIIQSIICVFLIVAIQLQAKGAGLGLGFGSSSQSYHSKRGFEKVLFRATIAMSIIFVFLSLVALI